MAIIPTEAGPFEIAGDTPTPTELQAIAHVIRQHREKKPERDAAKNAEMKATDQEIARWSETPSRPVQPVMYDVAEGVQQTIQPPPPPREDAPSTANIDLAKPNQLKTYPSPIAAGKDLARGIYDPKTGKWFQGSDATRDLAKSGDILVQALAPLSTGDPKQRQEIIVKQVPGAKAVDDKYGNPMIEMPDGKRYHTSGSDLEALRAALALTGGAVIGATLPVTGPLGLALTGAAAAGTQSVAEDLVARSAGAETGPWVDVDKALISAGLGAIPGGVIGLRNQIAKRVAAGLPLTDDALRALGLTDNQVKSLTPEMRNKISTIARQTFDNPNAIKSGYRGLLAEEGGLTGEAGLTRGEISGDVAQRIREQKLVGEKGTGTPIMEARRAAQDVKLSESQQALIAEAGGRPGQPPMKPEDAQTILKGARDEAEAAATAARDVKYDLARDPAAVEAAGGRMTAPAPHSSQLGRSTREMLAADEKVGHIVVSEEAGRLTPNAKEALAAVEKWSQSKVGPRADLAKTAKGQGDVVYDPEGLLAGPPGSTTRRVAMDQPGTATTFPEVTWQEAERLRQKLAGFRDAAADAARAAGKDRSQDLAAMEKILENFDKHFGPLNPLYAPARQAHEELQVVFKPGGSVDHDAATKAVLKVMGGPQGGAAIVDTMFGPSFSKGQAGQMLEHLNTRVFKDHPEARDAIREMAVRRLFLDDKGSALTPQQAVTKLEAAFGDRELSTYQGLLTGEQMATLRRAHERLKILAESRKPINPSGTGAMLGFVKDVLKGGGMGALIGSTGGVPGAATGLVVGTALQNQVPRYLANRAVNPPPGYFQAATTPGKVPGILGTAGASVDTSQPPGPADRLMESLLTR